ncbi:MAG: DUF3098 domain-containing protein [Bacteroidales bacterium]|jgi:hypothetical protein
MADIKKTASPAGRQTIDKKTEKEQFAFGKLNYQLMFLGLAFLLLGYILMIGGGSDDPNKFSWDLFNFQRITLAPILLLTGFVIEIFAIMKKPKVKE